MDSQALIDALHHAFGYTADNNRDIVGDSTIALFEVMEELKVEESYQFLIAYIVRNSEMIDRNLGRGN